MIITTKKRRVNPAATHRADLFGSNFILPDADPAFRPLVNILEGTEGYRIEIAAPGLRKEDFQLEVEDDRLLIRLAKASEESNVRYLRHEFGSYEWKKDFLLGDAIDRGAISASYEDGILRVSLPKKPEKAPRQIAVA